MYGTDSLKIIDAITENFLKVENVDGVRSATRPLGEKLTQASLGSQITLLSGGMQDVGSGFTPIMDGIASIRDGIDKVANGLGSGGINLQADLGGSVGKLQSGMAATQDGLAKLRAGTDQSAAGIKDVSAQLSTLSAGTVKTAGGVKKLAASVDSAISSLGKMVAADPKLQMNMDFQTAYGMLKAVSQSFGGVEASLAQISGGISQTTAGLTQIGGGLAGVGSGIQASSDALSKINGGLSAMKTGAEKAGTDLGTAADALKKISAGVGPINENLKKMEEGLTKINNAATDYGSTLNDVFYLPANVFTEYPEFRDAVSTYLSPDGKGTTFDLVLSVTPYSTAALDAIGEIRDTLSFSLKNTSLEGSSFATSGISSTFAEVRDLVSNDMAVVILFVLSGIFLILVLLLKSIVAPVYLLLTTVLSYVSTLGISYLFFCRILGQDGLHWSVPFFSFCVLVALGVDYNIFLITRVKEEYVPGKMREGITKALATTGGIITSCGIIMAGTFGSMMFSPMRPMVQVGFAACVGIIIDTFVIRSLVVPAIAVLVGEMSWWPGRKIVVTSLDRKKRVNL